MHLAHTLRLAVAFLATALLGAVIGLVGVFQHPAYWTVGDVRLPVGVVAGIGALLLAEFVAREALPFGLGPAVVLVAWTIVVVVFGAARPEGDIGVPAGLTGESFLYGGFVAGIAFAAVLAVLPGRATGRATGSARSGR